MNYFFFGPAQNWSISFIYYPGGLSIYLRHWSSWHTWTMVNYMENSDKDDNKPAAANDK